MHRHPQVRIVCCVLLALGFAGPSVADARAPQRLDGHATAFRPQSTRAITAADLAAARPDFAAEAALLADAADGRLDRHTLLAAAMIAGGHADPRAFSAYEHQLDLLAADLRSSGVLSGPPRNQARAVLLALHARLLTGEYQETCSDLSAAFDEGRYNCVSATVLFNCLAARCGLTTAAVECPAHVFSTVHSGGKSQSGGESTDVETTCPEWFDLPATAEVGRRPDGPRREVGPLGLVAIVYYNRGVDLLEARRFREAVAANAKALRLDPGNEAARGNLLAAVNNWALAESGAGRFDAAARILEAGFQLAPSHALFQVNYTAIHHDWADRLRAAGRPAEAERVLAAVTPRRPRVQSLDRTAPDWGTSLPFGAGFPDTGLTRPGL